jgi:hypothetical protein
MAKVAILGSCITRDLWRFRGDSGTDLMYICRTSLPSLMADPVAGFRPAAKPPAGLKPMPHRALAADINKTALAQLVAWRPTHLIFDFIDERFDLLSAGGGLVTHSWELEASGYLGQRAFRGARPIPRLSGAADRLWRDAAAEFAALIRATPLRNAELILHAAQWAPVSRADDGPHMAIENAEILPGRAADIAAHNALLTRYEAAFTALMPPMTRVAAAEHRLADPAHPWGLSPFHYVPEYYAAIWRQLEALGISAKIAA